MEFEFIHKSDSCRRLILIYPGWSCCKELYRDFSFPGWDVAVATDYSSAEADCTPLAGYPTIYLLAWSLGVFMASRTLPEGLVTAAFALNGTLSPVDDQEGIPTAIYYGTASGLTPASLRKFRRRMAGDGETFRRFFDDCFSESETLTLKNQLLAIAGMQTTSRETLLPWRRAFVSDNDAIFPAANMQAAWERRGVDVRHIDAPHYVDMHDIAQAVIPETDKISERFGRACGTYDDNARAQRIMARHLAEHLSDMNPRHGGTVLELGAGTGLFTSEYVSLLNPIHISFVDITDVRPSVDFLKSVECAYHTADAEEWIASADKRFDSILSAATVQWFVNLPLFLHNCSERLNPGGIVALSTFLPGNLSELDKFRPSPIHYHEVAELRKFMEEVFDDVRVTTEEITIPFSSPRELLMHLKQTGVAGSAPSSGLSAARLRNVTTLTYRCVYLTGRRRGH